MSEFIEECRREWKRLRVPDPLANEMAADLAADLHEAEAEGASPEELLGDATSDPQAFARRWAEERGLVEHPPRTRRYGRLAIGLVVLVLVGGGIVAALLLRQGQSTIARVPVPLFAGEKSGTATRGARAAGLTVTIRYRNSGSSRSGIVVAQSPAAGARVPRGSPLLLVVGR